MYDKTSIKLDDIRKLT